MSTPRLALPKDYGEATRWKTDLENSARCAAKNVEEALRCANECKLRDEKTQELASKVLADAYRLMREHEQLLCAVALNQPVDSPVGSSSPSVHQTGATTLSAAVPVQATPVDAIIQKLTPTATPLDEPFSDGNQELETTEQSHHARQPPTGKRKPTTDVATSKPAKLVKVEPTVDWDASSVADSSSTATDMDFADWEDFDSDNSLSDDDDDDFDSDNDDDDDVPGALASSFMDFHQHLPSVFVLIDPGVPASMINKKVFDAIPVADKPKVRQGCLDPESAATYQVARTYGVATFRIITLERQFEHDFWLCDMDEEGVAGMDLAKKLQKWAPKGYRFDNVNRCRPPARARTSVPAPSSQTLEVPVQENRQPTQQPAVARVSNVANEAEVPVSLCSSSDPTVPGNICDAYRKSNLQQSVLQHQGNQEQCTLPANSRATAVVADVFARTGESPPTVSNSATVTTSATGIMKKQATTSALLDTGQLPGNPATQLQPVAASTRITQQPIKEHKNVA